MMLSRKRATAYAAIGGYLNFSVSLVRGFILIPLYLTYISAEVYGYWLATGGIVSILSFIDIGINRNVQRKMSYLFGRSEYSLLKTTFFNGALTYILVAFLIISSAIIAGLFLPTIFKIPAESSALIQFCFGLSVLSFIISIISQYFNTLSSSILLPFMPSIWQSVMGVVGIIVTVMLLNGGIGLYALPMGQLATSIGTFGGIIIITIVRYRQLPEKATISIEKIKSLIVESGPIFLGKTGQSIVKQIEPVLITIIIGPAVTTAFVITKRAADFIAIALNIPLGAVFPSMVNLISSNHTEKIRNLLVKLVSVIIIMATITLTSYVLLNESFIGLWVGEDMYLSNTITFLIAIGLLFRILMNLSTDIIFGFGMVTFSSMLQFFEGIFRIVIMTLLLVTIGVRGAPVGMALSCLSILLIVIMKNKRNIFTSIYNTKAYKAIKYYLLYVIVFIILVSRINLSNLSWAQFFVSGTIFLSILSLPIILNATLRKIVSFK